MNRLVSGPAMPLEEVRIRRAEAEDAAAILDLLADLAHTLGEPEARRSTVEDIERHGFGETRHFQVLIAETGDAAVGLVLFFYNFSTWRGRLGVFIQDLHVVESFRGTGLGRRLLASAARQGRAAGCTHLRLSVHPTNQSAQAFYQRMGLAARDDESIFQVSDRAFDKLSEAGT